MEYGKIEDRVDERVNFAKGQLWYVQYNDAVGSEEKVGRVALIVSSYAAAESMKMVTVVWLTTTPKSGGTTVEIMSARKRSFAICTQIHTIDKARLTSYMGDVTDAEMLKVEVALRKVLGLPLKIDNIEMVNKPESENKSDKIAELEMELSIHKRLYEKAIEKIIELKFEKDCATRVVELPKPVVEKVEEPTEELDLSGLTEKFKVYDQRKKMSDEEVAATLEQAGMKKKADGGTRVFGGGRAKLAANAKPINVNTSDLADFENIGLGTMTAKNIITWRKKHGPFISLEDMLLVPRFGKGCLRTFESVLEV